MNRCFSPYYLRQSAASNPASRVYFNPLRPRPIHATTWKRSTSTVGVHKTGHIDLKPGEGLLFFDSLFARFPFPAIAGLVTGLWQIFFR